MLSSGIQDGRPKCGPICDLLVGKTVRLFLFSALFCLVGVLRDPASAALSTNDLSGQTATDLVNILVGGGVSVSNVTYVGITSSAGSFNGGIGIIGFEDGIVLSTGNISSVVGPNISDGTTGTNFTPGDTDLDVLAGVSTFDATVLEFDFVPSSSALFFDYVFASEEYNEFANFSVNDTFAFFVNGTNVAVLPGTSIVVSINTVNGGNPLGTNAQNPAFYLNNDLSDGGGAIDTEMDGLTVVLSVQAMVNAGVTNHIKLAIADGGDSSLDSNVFIRAGSLAAFTLTNSPTPTLTATWSPTYTPTYTPSWTPTYSATFTWTMTSSLTSTVTPTSTHSLTFTQTPTPTWTSTVTPTSTWTPTITPTSTLSATNTWTPTFTQTPTFTGTVTPTATPTPFTTLTLDLFDASGEKVHSITLYQPGLESALPDELELVWVFDETTKVMIPLIPGGLDLWDGLLGDEAMVPAGLYHVVIRSSNPEAGSDEMARFNVSIVIVQSREHVEILDASGNVIQTLEVTGSTNGELTLSNEVLILARVGTNVEINSGGVSLMGAGGGPLVWDGTNASGETVSPGIYTVRYVKVLPDGTEVMQEITVVVQANLFESGEAVVLVPNPVVGLDKVTIYVNTIGLNMIGGSQGNARLYTLDGALVHSVVLDPILGIGELDIRGLAAGFYLVVVKFEGPDLRRPQVVIKRLAILR